MNRNLLIFAVILLVLVGAAYFTLNGRLGGKTVDIKGHTVKVEVADNEAEHTKGLSGRDPLAQDQGMLFVFNGQVQYPFWMKDMRFPIDIIFLKDSKVAMIYDSVQPTVTVDGEKHQNLTLYPPPSGSTQVLEINAGLAKKYGLKVGDSIKVDL